MPVDLIFGNSKIFNIIIVDTLGMGLSSNQN
jgi:hypothetical protein